MAATQVSGSHHIEKGYKTILPNSGNFVYLSAEIMRPLDVLTVYVEYEVTKLGFTRTGSEVWTPKALDKDSILNTVLLKGAALLLNNKKGQVLYTLPEFVNLIPLPRGEVTFHAVEPKDNPTYQAAQNLAMTAWNQAYGKRT